MIIVDTSVWIDHLSRRDELLVGLVENAQVIAHPYVVGEVMLGSIADRAAVLLFLNQLPTSLPARHAEVLHLLTTRNLGGCGIGYVDLHLLASALQTGSRLWTRDKRLRRVAERLTVGASFA